MRASHLGAHIFLEWRGLVIQSEESCLRMSWFGGLAQSLSYLPLKSRFSYGTCPTPNSLIWGMETILSLTKRLSQSEVSWHLWIASCCTGCLTGQVICQVTSVICDWPQQWGDQYRKTTNHKIQISETSKEGLALQGFVSRKGYVNVRETWLVIMI